MRKLVNFSLERQLVVSINTLAQELYSPLRELVREIPEFCAADRGRATEGGDDDLWCDNGGQQLLGRGHAQQTQGN